MSVPTDYNLQYDDYCGTYERYNCELPSVCPDGMSFSANRRTFCRDVTILDDLTVDMLTETQNLRVVDSFIDIGGIRFVLGNIETESRSYAALIASGPAPDTPDIEPEPEIEEPQ